ncbi:hypothetical protein K3495_g3903 [Podosphaera aphanis]|nr:hypothetical protein K3495_g3903 [Podosphaera aphanis]
MTKDALQILGNSVGLNYKHIAVNYQEKGDPKGLWEALQNVNPVNDPTVISSLRREFMTTTFDPAKERIQDVLTKLNNIKIKLQDTALPLTDENVKETLIQSIPSENPLWNMAKINAIRDDKGLMETVTTLKVEYEYGSDSYLKPSEIPYCDTVTSKKRSCTLSKAYPTLTTYTFFTRKTDIVTLIDSGASQHFSGIKEDFKSLKRWGSPKLIRVADGKIIFCEGQGTIRLKSRKQIIALDNVWFVPEFRKLRLLSVHEFNKWGVEVLFANQQCKVMLEGKVLFDAMAEDGVYKVEEDTSFEEDVTIHY